MSAASQAEKRFLIVNADDFGYSTEVNVAVLRAHREGVLTSASLMVAEPGWEEAVAIARQTPTLGVGLHVAITYDRALLSAGEIPALVGSDGKFGADPFRVGLKYAFSKAAQAQLRREMDAQFARFAATGLPWSHADGHQHFHMHPVVWAHFLDLCDQYGVTRIRLPHEELRAHLRDGGDRSPLNTLALLAFRILRLRALRMLRAREPQNGRVYFVCDRVYGQLQTGNMNAAYVERLLNRLTGLTNEIYFHPGAPHARPLPAVGATGDENLNEKDVELAALLNPVLRACVESHALCLGTYAEVEAQVRQAPLPPVP